MRRYAAALVLLCAAVLWKASVNIHATLPYPRYVDEPFISIAAHRTVTTGTFHPYDYNYPSLPKHLAAAGMSIGFLRGVARGEVTEVRQIGNIDYPYYDVPIVMQAARMLFALLAVLALGATGYVAWLAFREPSTLLLAPLLMLAAPLYFSESWTYLNVDIVGTCFAVLAMAACLLGTRRPSFIQSAVLPGVLVGCAAASKYPFGAVLAPVLAAIGFYFSGPRRLRAWSISILAATATFLVAVPYSLRDIPNFLNGLSVEAFHYASGHRGFQEEPGAAQFVYYATYLASEFGAAAVVALLGVAAYAVVDWRRTVVLALYPTLLLGALSAQRTHFPRNALSLYPFIALFAAFGLVRLHAWVLGRFARHHHPSPKPLKPAARLLWLALTLVLVPVWHLGDVVRGQSDSRNLVKDWLRARVPPGWTVVVPSQLAFDGRDLNASGWPVMTVDLQATQDETSLEALLATMPMSSVILVPDWGVDDRFAGSQPVADALNTLARRWRPMRRFGTNPVLVNYTYPVPWGDPAFFVAVARQPR